jgi:hypothetical protein
MGKNSKSHVLKHEDNLLSKAIVKIQNILNNIKTKIILKKIKNATLENDTQKVADYFIELQLLIGFNNALKLLSQDTLDIVNKKGSLK